MISPRRNPTRKSKLPNVDPVRSHIMRSVPRAHSKPEVAVRRLLHALGYRFRLHDRRLPGTPDIALSKYKTCIFVHGCFWHRHENCPKTTDPKTRAAFWRKKFRDNVARDARNVAALEELGWKPIVIWECEARDVASLQSKLERQLRPVSGTQQKTGQRK